jgi:transposase
MKQIIKLLDKNLKYKNYEIKDDTIYINVESKRKKTTCPKCGKETDKVHSKYIREFKDLPISGKKVVIRLENKIYFCTNKECEIKRFSEKHEFLSKYGKMTKRLEEEIINIAEKNSLIETSKILRKNMVNVSKSTVSNILKKRRLKQKKK